MTTIAVILGALAAIAGLVIWISKRGEAKGRAETQVEVFRGTHDRAADANAAKAAVRDTPEEIANDVFNRDRG